MPLFLSEIMSPESGDRGVAQGFVDKAARCALREDDALLHLTVGDIAEELKGFEIAGLRSVAVDDGYAEDRFVP